MDLHTYLPVTIPVNNADMKKIHNTYVCQQLLGIKNWNNVLHSLPFIKGSRFGYTDSTTHSFVDMGKVSPDITRCIEVLNLAGV